MDISIWQNERSVDCIRCLECTACPVVSYQTVFETPARGRRPRICPAPRQVDVVDHAARQDRRAGHADPRPLRRRHVLLHHRGPEQPVRRHDQGPGRGADPRHRQEHPARHARQLRPGRPGDLRAHRHRARHREPADLRRERQGHQVRRQEGGRPDDRGHRPGDLQGRRAEHAVPRRARLQRLLHGRDDPQRDLLPRLPRDRAPRCCRSSSSASR